MESAKRYGLAGSASGDLVFRERVDGPFVEYMKYAALANHVAQLERANLAYCEENANLLGRAMKAEAALTIDDVMVERVVRAMAGVRVPLVDEDGDEIFVADALAQAFGDKDIGRALEIIRHMADDAIEILNPKEQGNG